MRKLLRAIPTLACTLILGCSNPAARTEIDTGALPARLPASAAGTRYRSYFGEKLPVRNENAACKRLPPNLRSMLYEQFLHLSESRGAKVTGRDAANFSKILEIAWSQGHSNASQLQDSTGGGETISTARLFRDNLRKDKHDRSIKTSLDSRRTLLTSPRVKTEKSTRIGLFQVRESDLESSTPAQVQWKAIRALATRAPEEAADRCGTRWMYDNSERELAEAFTEMSNCKPEEAGCFRKWATLCPNLGLALELSGADLRLKKSKPVCVDAFKSLLRK